MSSRFARRQRLTLPATFVMLAMSLLLLVPALDIAAQPIRSNPTPTPTPEFNPGLVAQPTETPTEVPERVSPTEIPAPTEVVPEVIEPGTITLNVGACDDVAFDPATASGLNAFMEACQGPDGEFEFTVSDGAGFSATAWTALGTVSFEVPATTISMVETIPFGWGDPAVFCWSNLLPTPSDTPFIGNGPTWDVQPGENVECWWFNLSQPPTELHTIRVTAFECPPEADLGADYWTLATSCLDGAMGGVAFDLQTDADTRDGTTGATGTIEWTEVDLGASGIAQIDEAVPGGYGDPTVWCVSFPEAAGDPEDFDNFAVDATDGAITVQPEQHEPFIFECRYFHQPFIGSGDLADPSSVGDGGGNTIMLDKRDCPAGTDPDQFLAQFNIACPVAFPDVDFTLSHSGSDFPGTTGGDGLVIWNGLPNDAFSVQESIPAGYDDPVVFCGFSDEPGGDIFHIAQVDATGGQIEAEIEAGPLDFHCYWFNIPDPDLGSLTVTKWLCPVGFDPAVDNHYINCLDLWDGVIFTLNDLQATTGEAGPGLAAFLNLPPGNYDLLETVPDGIAEMYFSGCYVDEAPAPITIVLTDPPTLQVTVDAGEHWVCHAYNVPEEVEENTIIVDKWQCPEGAAVWQSHHWLSTNCTDPHDGIEFEITTDFGWVTMQTVGGTIQLGPIGPMFDVAIQEDIPDGFGDPAVYCAVDDGAHFQIGAPGGYWEHEFADDDVAETLSCEVYNIPEEENSLHLFKWQCPEGTAPNQSRGWYEDNCLVQHDGVLFSVASDLGVAAAPTAGGQVQFDGLPAGEVGIQEHIPDGFGSPEVFCMSEGLPWQLHNVPTGHWSHEFAADGESEVRICYVYNIPGEPGSITLEKWTCPPGYDLHAWGADPLTDCTEATNGVQFQFGLAAEGSLAELQTTGDILDGAVVFDNLEPDTYKAVELVPDGIESVFVLECTGHIMGVLQSYPLKTGNVLEIDLDAGEHLTCYWFNVPESEGGEITLFKYTCTTKTFISEVDCQIEEDSVTFDLLIYNEGTATWDVIDTRATDGFGRIDWIDLNPGEYQVAEHGESWCHIVFDPADDGGHVTVLTGDHAHIHVYNCDGTPGDPGDTPTKYPNTGVEPMLNHPTSTVPGASMFAPGTVE